MAKMHFHNGDETKIIKPFHKQLKRHKNWLKLSIFLNVIFLIIIIAQRHL